jgi:hypothetical protein
MSERSERSMWMVRSARSAEEFIRTPPEAVGRVSEWDERMPTVRPPRRRGERCRRSRAAMGRGGAAPGMS